MSNEVTTFSKEKLDLIKGMFAKDATDMEFNLFVSMSERLQLDPVIKQIYFVKFSGKMSIIVGIDGYRLIADRTGKYMPGKDTVYNYDKDGRLFSATSYVKKLGPDGQWHEFGATAIRAEYDTGINQWKKGPHYMLAKCAESLALRKGWPAEFSGTHTEEEMDKAIVDIESVRSPTKSLEIGNKLVVEPKGPLISMQEAIALHALIGDDKDYKERILSHYKAADFFDIEHKHLALIMEKAKAHNEERLKKEMDTV